MNPTKTVALLAAVAALSACDTTPSTSASGGATSSSTDGATTSATSSDASSASSTDASSGVGSTSSASGTASSTASSSGSGGPITACADIGATECFSNYDCPSMGDRCENKGTPNDQVPCCVPGVRGAGVAGAPCTSENDCKSSLCFELSSSNVCSDVCTSSGECPKPPFAGGCGPIAFSGSNDEFCLP